MPSERRRGRLRSQHGAGGAPPSRRPRGGTTAPRPARQRLVEGGGAGRARAAAEVGGLHRPWAAPGRHHVRGTQGVAEPGGVGIPRLAALQRRDRPSRRRCRRPRHHSASAWSIGVVVQGRGQGVARGAGALRPGVGAGVEGVGVAAVVVELLGGVEPRAVDVDGAVADVGSTSAPAPRPGRRRRGRTCSRGTSRRPLGTAAPRSPRSVRSSPRSRQPAHRVDTPAARRRSRSARDSTWTTRPRVRFTPANVVRGLLSLLGPVLSRRRQNAWAISSPNSSCSSAPSRPSPEPGADVGAVAQQEVHAVGVADEVDDLRAGR